MIHRRWRGFAASQLVGAFVVFASGAALAAEYQAPTPQVIAAQLDEILTSENEGRGAEVAPLVDDAAFLRRATVDLIGRIPTVDEYKQFFAMPAVDRRAKLIDRLLSDERFTDRWTVFMSDLLRIRSNADGGSQLQAYIYQAVRDNVPYDEICRRLISASGKPGTTPEVGFILGDNADPMALAGAASQMLMGIRIACAECHDHPFDVWTREEFYSFAAYFGKTRRVESELTGVVYTTEMATTAVLWPPADMARNGEPRAPMKPDFPFATVGKDETPQYMARLQMMRDMQAQAKNRPEGPSLDDLLAASETTVKKAANGQGKEFFDIATEAKKERSKIDVQGDLYKASQLRIEVANLITSPRNRYFSRSFVNRVWADLVGHGFVEPIDDFSEANPPSHPATLDLLADEFVAGGYDIRRLIATIVATEAYQRGRLYNVGPGIREEAEAAFTSSPVRRMIAESLYDSIVQAGHLFDFKYPEGANTKTVSRLVRIAVPREGGELASIGTPQGAPGGEMAMSKPMMVGGGYDLETAIEVNFDAVLAADSAAPMVDQMKVMSNEELEAMRMMQDEKRPQSPRMRYVERYQDVVIDDNPKFVSATRMASPAPQAHFLRVFGQPGRVDLGDHREETASMRQALMMLNGKLTHEAARVGDFEPIYPLVVGEKANLKSAIQFAYQEILTRDPSAEELAEAEEIVASGESTREGVADLRWILFNCHEFRFLP